MTIDEITKEINQVRNVSRRQVLRYMKRLKIKPISELRTNPMHYGEDVPKIILSKLGLRIVTMPQLRAERAKAQKARAA